MKNTKKIISTLGLSLMVLGSSAVVFANDIPTPADLLSDLTNQPVESIVEMKSDSSYGKVAVELGVSDSFKALMLENKKAILDLRVAEGRITVEQANEIYEKLTSHIENCDGSSIRVDGEKMFLGFGNGNGKMSGVGNGEGRGAQKGQRLQQHR